MLVPNVVRKLSPFTYAPASTFLGTPKSEDRCAVLRHCGVLAVLHLNLVIRKSQCSSACGCGMMRRAAEIVYFNPQNDE